MQQIDRVVPRKAWNGLDTSSQITLTYFQRVQLGIGNAQSGILHQEESNHVKRKTDKDEKEYTPHRPSRMIRAFDDVYRTSIALA